jgi:tricarballylate dehydrogenase
VHVLEKASLAERGGNTRFTAGIYRFPFNGIAIAYDTKATRLETDSRGAVVGVETLGPDGKRLIQCRSVVLAAGGFEANAEMRTRCLGLDRELAKVRRTRFNTGDAIRMALELGAQPYGHWSCGHAVACDAQAPAVGNPRIGTSIKNTHILSVLW